MSQFLNTRSVLRYVATVAFSIFSYAVMAQSAPAADACGHALSAFQKNLYNHYLAGPDSLREFVFIGRGVHLLDVHEADAWARSIEAQTCPTGDRMASATRTPDATPAVVTLGIAPANDGSDGCTTNANDVMHCTARSERSRAAVVAELRNAQAAGGVRVGELSDAPIGNMVPANAAVAMTRTEVRQQLSLARSSHQLAFGER